jgi:hypothetical protein
MSDDLVKRPLDEVFDTQREVEHNPCGAWQAIQSQANRIEELDDIIRHDRGRIEELVSMVNSKDARIEELEGKLAKALDGLHEAENAPEPDRHVPEFRHVMDIIGAILAELKGEDRG